MLIEWNGHSEFLLESASGYRILTDPFDPNTGYPMRRPGADAVVVSHSHGDHSYLDKVDGHPIVLDAPGRTELGDGITVESILGDHDDCQGKKRGKTLITRIRMDGLSIAHLGDLGCPLSPEQLDFLSGTDILMVPVGGFFTIDGETAADLVRAVSPKVTIPMHYKTKWNESWPITGPEPFYEAMCLPLPDPVPLLRVTAEDIVCLPATVMFETPEES